MSKIPSWNYRPLAEEAVISGLPVTAVAGAAFALSHVFNSFSLMVAAGIAGRAIYEAYGARISEKKKHSDVQKMLDVGAMIKMDPDNPRDRDFIEDVKESAVLFGMPENSITPYYATRAFLLATHLAPLVAMQPEAVPLRLASVESNYFGVSTMQGYMMTTPQAIERFADKDARKFILGHERAHEMLGDSIALHRPGQLIGAAALRPLLLATASLMVINFVLQLGGATPEFVASSAPFNDAGYIWGPTRALVVTGVCIPLYSLAMAGAARLVERRADRNTLYKTGNLEAAVQALIELEDNAPAPRTIFERMSGWFYDHPRLGARLGFLRAAWPRIAEQRRREGRPVPPGLKPAIS